MKHPILIAILALASALASPVTSAKATAQDHPWQGLWQGQVGQQRIVLALHEDARQNLGGRYFDERFGRDVSLWGPEIAAGAQATTVELLECPPDYGSVYEPCPNPSARWSVPRPSVQTQGPRVIVLEGTRQPSAPEGRRPPPPELIRLTRLGDYQSNAEAFGDRYEQRRLRGIRGETVPGGQLGPVRWAWLRDVRSRLTAPQFTQGATPAVLAHINRGYQKQWRERISHALTAVDYEDDVRVVFANPRWLTTHHSVGYYFAGAAHPSSNFSSQTLDLQTGQPVDWKRVFRLTDPRPVNLDLTRADLLAAQVLKAMTAQVAAQPISGKQPDGTEAADESCFAMVLAHYQCQGGRCASPELLRGNTPADWWIWPTAQGLAVSPDPYPEVARACRGEHVVLPWQRVRATLIKPQALP